jgi:hypothetical protein
MNKKDINKENNKLFGFSSILTDPEEEIGTRIAPSPIKTKKQEFEIYEDGTKCPICMNCGTLTHSLKTKNDLWFCSEECMKEFVPKNNIKDGCIGCEFQSVCLDFFSLCLYSDWVYYADCIPKLLQSYPKQMKRFFKKGTVKESEDIK